MINPELIPTSEQLSAITMMIENKIGIMFGGPGTGKSFTINHIIKWADEQNYVTLQASPTGKAARRMIEMTGRNASTIHTLLACQYDPQHGFIFEYNEHNPLPCDLLIIDEASMIDNTLMAHMLEAVDTKRTRILLVGDSNQLPSVGAGAILRDLLDSNIVPKVELTIIHRNSGTIVKSCHKIKNGDIYNSDKKIDLDKESPDNLIHVEMSDPVKILAAVKKIVSERMPLRGFNPVEDVQVISPVNVKGLLSCASINKVLQEVLNPPAEQEQGQNRNWYDGWATFDNDKDNKPPKFNNDFERLDYEAKQSTESGNNDSTPDKVKKEKPVFRVGDKVINTKNEKVEKTDGFQSAIVNGDIGIIKEVNKKNIVVLFSDPVRKVKLSKNTKNLLHAYCITCHKFQGSEAPVIILPVHRQFNYFLTNSWIYTAISRGKVIVITVGEFATIMRAIRNRVPNERFTMLKELLIDGYGGGVDEGIDCDLGVLIEDEFAEL